MEPRRDGRSPARARRGRGGVRRRRRRPGYERGDGCAASAAQTTAAATSEAAAATSEPPASALAGATTIDASTATTVPLADVQDAELELGSPDYLVELDGTVWVKLDGGDVVAVDPATAKELRSLDVDPGQEQLCQGLGAGGGYLWTCTGSDVVRIDPETATIVDTIPAAKIPDQANLPFQEGRIWVLGGNGDRLVGIDAASAKPGDPVALPRLLLGRRAGRRQHRVGGVPPGEPDPAGRRRRRRGPAADRPRGADHRVGHR